MFKLLISGIALVLFSGKSLPCGETPALNQKIIGFAKKHIGKKVGQGECWDLASQALNFAGASWDHDLKFGKEVNLEMDCIFPGDVIQFEGVEIEYWEGNAFFSMELEHHTAIIFTVKGKGDFLLAEQNTTAHGRKVSIDPLRIKDVKKGTFKIYRPTN